MVKPNLANEKSRYYKFTIYVDPVAKKRVRVYNRGGHIHGVNPSKADEDVFRRLFMKIKNKPPQPIEIGLLLGMKFYRNLPKSTRKMDLQFVESEIYRPTTKPDLDNYIKLAKDAGSGILWKDDKIIVGYLPGTGKYFTLDKPRIEFEILTAGADVHTLYMQLLENEVKRQKALHLSLDDFS